MKKYTIPNEKIKIFNKTVEYDFPKYTTQLISVCSTIHSY